VGQAVGGRAKIRSVGRKARGASPAEPASAGEPRDPAILAALWSAAGLAAFWSFGFTVLQGGDLWWHLAAGRWMAQEHRLARFDPFSFTRHGLPWLHHEWLSDVLFFVWSRLFGTASLVYWKWGVIALAYLVLQRALRRATRSEASAWISAAWAAAVAAPFLDIRPHLYTLLGYAAVVALAQAGSRLLWLAPVLFVVWANLHGGFLFGLGAFAILLFFLEFRSGDPVRRRRAVSTWILSAAAGLVNPNGAAAYAYPLHYAFDAASPYRRIGEWLSPFRAGGIASPLLPAAIAVWAGAMAALFLPRKVLRRVPLAVPGLALSCVTLAMALRSRRFIPLFGISQALVLAPAAAALLERFGRKWALSRKGRTLWSAGAAIVALAAGCLRLADYPLSRAAFPFLVVEDSFPVDTVDFLQANRIRGNVLAAYRWGGYLLDRSGGRLRDFIDGRADTVFDDGVLRRYLAVESREPGWMEVVDSSRADFVLWPGGEREVWEALVGSGQWRLLYADSVSVLLARAAWRPPKPLAAPPDGPYRQLTLAREARAAGNLAAAQAHLERAAADPGVSEACHMLARVLALRGRVGEARLTEALCQERFPQPLRRRSFEEFLQMIPASAGDSTGH
jgi:hypothetical protein